MAQEPDPLSTAPEGTDAPPDATLIERDIERTRAEMSETIDAIGARFEPAYLREQAKDAVRETARDAGTSMIDTLRDNPLPAAIAGLSIAWLFANRSSGSSSAHRVSSRDSMSYGAGYEARGTYGGRPVGESAGYAGATGGPSAQDRMANAAGGLKDQTADALDTARERAHDLGDSVAESAHHLQDQVTQAGERTVTWLEDQMHRNPLAAGAVALAAGAIVGLSVPETNAENDLFGAQSARVGRALTQKTEEALDQAKSMASSVANEAKKKTQEVAAHAEESSETVSNAARPEATAATGTHGGATSEPRGTGAARPASSR